MEALEADLADLSSKVTVSMRRIDLHSNTSNLLSILFQRASLISKVESKLSVKEEIAMVASDCLGYRKDFDNLRNSDAFTLLVLDTRIGHLTYTSLPSK